VTKATQWKHQGVPSDVIAASVEWAKEQLEEEEDDEEEEGDMEE
jgi:hypothetical protein